eukprot:354803-Chlamydomonas_euryale.AAC.1
MSRASWHTKAGLAMIRASGHTKAGLATSRASRHTKAGLAMIRAPWHTSLSFMDLLVGNQKTHAFAFLLFLPLFAGFPLFRPVLFRPLCLPFLSAPGGR